MKLGLNLLNYGPDTTPELLVRWARFAEESGFAIAMISDHIAVTPEVQALYPVPFYDPFATIGWLAAHTERLLLGTSVAVLPYRHPLQTARVGANLDRFSDGRFVLGVGSGWSEQEYAALGVPFERRTAITDEYLAAIVQAWTSDVASSVGPHAPYQKIYTAPRPVRRPHPPIWVGGASLTAIRRALRYGDAWHPINPHPRWLQETGMPTLRAGAAEAGIAPPALCPRIRAQPTATALPDSERVLGEGSLDQIRADLADLAELCAECVVLDTYLGPDLRRPCEEDWRILETVAALHP
jgi:probable F420-dependent oxidoreductase